MDNSAILSDLQPSEAANPPSSNRGVHPKKEHPPTTQDHARICKNAAWDWYQASFIADPETVISTICNELVCVPEPAKPQPPYLYGVAFHPINPHSGLINKKMTLFTLHYGGINERVLLRATSDEASELTPFIRKHWPDHQVSRCDMALDFEEPGIFEDISSWLLEYAKDNRLKTGFAGDWANGSQGRTLYVGSRNSAVLIRLYEKGHEQIAKGSKHASLDWVRFEAEIKPQTKEAKKRMATMQPDECFGVSRLLREFAQIYGGRYDAVKIGKGKAEKSQNPLHYMAIQYGDLLTEYLSEQMEEKPADQVLSDLLALIASEKATKKQNTEKLNVKRSWAAGALWQAGQLPALPLAPLPVRQYPMPVHGLRFRPVCKAVGRC